MAAQAGVRSARADHLDRRGHRPDFRDRARRGVLLKDGTTIPADLVVMAVGIRPSVAIARDAGVVVNRGILVDDHMVTSDPAILAVGEGVEHDGHVYGLPAAVWGEKDGTVPNSERLVSRQRPFFATPGEAKPEWRWLAPVRAARPGGAGQRGLRRDGAVPVRRRSVCRRALFHVRWPRAADRSGELPPRDTFWRCWAESPARPRC